MFKKQLKSDESGIVAIVVTMLMMIVISLITVGYVQAALREQRQVIDKQLSVQAAYAAESGINYAQSIVKLRYAANQSLAKNQCGDDPGGTPNPYTNYQQIDSARGIEITCLLVRDRLEIQNFQDVGMKSKVTQIKNANGLQNLRTIYIAWESSAGNGYSVSTPGCISDSTGYFPQNTITEPWSCVHPLLRIDLVPISGNNLTQASLQSTQYSAFFFPINSGSGTTSYASGMGNSIGSIVPVGCNNSLTPRKCIVQIDLGANAGPQFGVRIMSLYGNSNVSIYADDAGGSRATMIEGQVVIDSTAKAMDIIKRQQAWLSANGEIPDWAIATTGGGLCKLFSIVRGSIQNDADPLCVVP